MPEPLDNNSFCRFHPTDWFHTVGCEHMNWDGFVCYICGKDLDFITTQDNRLQKVVQKQAINHWFCFTCSRIDYSPVTLKTYLTNKSKTKDILSKTNILPELDDKHIGIIERMNRKQT